MLVEIKNLMKRYNDIVALDNANLSIKEGEIFGLLGPNGAGKTTAINVMLGLTRMDSGEVSIFGKNIIDKGLEIKKDVGLVPQDIALFDDLTAYENVSFFGRLYGISGNLLKTRIEEALNFTGLWDKRKDFPKKYSGGMKRRLNIACALVQHPRLIIMDEPTVGIDPQSRNHILQSVRELNKMGSTIIYTSHYMEEVEEICTNIAIMDHGRVIAKGSSDELKALISSEEKMNIELSSANYTITESIKKVTGVRDCTISGCQLNIISAKGSKNLGEIIQCITDTDTRIMSLNVEKPSLEGVFLTLTGRSLRD